MLQGLKTQCLQVHSGARHKLWPFLVLVLSLEVSKQMRAPLEGVQHGLPALYVLLCAGLGFLAFGLC